jgi:hypothetical protein
MLLLPVFALLKIKKIAAWKEKLANLFAHPVIAGLLFIPLMSYYFTLYLRFPEQLNLVEDWFVFVFSFTLLLYGIFLGGSDRFWKNCERFRYWFCGIALTSIAMLFILFWWDFKLPTEQNNRLYLYGFLNALHIWTLIISFLGLAKHHLNFTNPFLKYANEAVYPFYILHQTVIVVSGYYVAQWNLPIAVKLIVLIIICFGSLFILYKWVIKPFLVTRILFGLKIKKQTTLRRPEVVAVP